MTGKKGGVITKTWYLPPRFFCSFRKWGELVGKKKKKEKVGLG